MPDILDVFDLYVASTAPNGQPGAGWGRFTNLPQQINSPVIVLVRQGVGKNSLGTQLQALHTAITNGAFTVSSEDVAILSGHGVQTQELADSIAALRQQIG